ncbi:hypothetical protein HORIV_59020 [Vreelandella olivaria]|uniref:Uncharacterized protein n=1 Tax=Vreelandella olivaria TaxID=390919 RepID=A0ABN5X312_9GAMM|nr:hypothetical protein HORIV_59020 [Halomonas olivaria]
MVADPLKKHLEGDTIVEILARVNFVAEIDPGFVKGVQNGTPAFGQFVKRGFDEPAGR